jgi:hypothetical protein
MFHRRQRSSTWNGRRRLVSVVLALPAVVVLVVASGVAQPAYAGPVRLIAATSQARHAAPSPLGPRQQSQPAPLPHRPETSARAVTAATASSAPRALAAAKTPPTTAVPTTAVPTTAVPTTAVPTTAVPTAPPTTEAAAASAAPGWGCGDALAYLQAHAAPGFTFACPGNALGHQGMTCVDVAGICPGEHLIAIADPCPAAYMNEASNSRVFAGLSDTAIDPYGSCR